MFYLLSGVEVEIDFVVCCHAQLMDSHTQVMGSHTQVMGSHIHVVASLYEIHK